MKKINFKQLDKKYYLVGLLLIIIIGLLIYGVVFAFNHYNDSDKVKLNNIDGKYNLSSNQLDYLEQPNPNLKKISDSLPKVEDTITEIKVDTVKELFQTSKKSILVIVRNDCSYCQSFEPKLNEALKYYDVNAYKVNLSNNKNNSDLFKYLDFDGTPATLIIDGSKVVHSLSGDTDIETIKAFIDYYYIREN